jgi:hypothetical protein
VIVGRNTEIVSLATIVSGTAYTAPWPETVNEDGSSACCGETSAVSSPESVTTVVAMGADVVDVGSGADVVSVWPLPVHAAVIATNKKRTDLARFITHLQIHGRAATNRRVRAEVPG